MRVLLVSANTERIQMPTVPLGLMMVAEDAYGSVLLKRIHDFAPEAIGISVRNIDDQSMENPKFLLEGVRPLVQWCRDPPLEPLDPRPPQ